jgi:hypothetical protein
MQAVFDGIHQIVMENPRFAETSGSRPDFRQTLSQETVLSICAHSSQAMVELDPPTERECQHCGRRDVWDPDAEGWRIRNEARAGDPFCIHEWDINGAYHPIRE